MESNFRVVCGIGGCPKTYTVVHSLKKHVYRAHRSVLNAPVPNTSSEAEPDQEHTNDADEDGLDCTFESANVVDESDTLRSAPRTDAVDISVDEPEGN
ncbi:hypothetical protein MTO96_039403 [Rhipicephalus appendiculatus]